MKEIEVTCQIYDSITKIIEELIKKGFKYEKEFIIQDSYFHNLKNEEFSIKNGILTDSLVVRYVNEDDKKIICKRNTLNNTEKSILKVSNIENAKPFLTEEQSRVVDEINIMTPESIHLNSFMYEPIIDMSDWALKRLFVEALKLNGLEFDDIK